MKPHRCNWFTDPHNTTLSPPLYIWFTFCSAILLILCRTATPAPTLALPTPTATLPPPTALPTATLWAATLTSTPPPPSPTDTPIPPATATPTDTPSPLPTDTPQALATPIPPPPPSAGGCPAGTFSASKESDKYHYPDCRHAKKILPENLICFESTDAARAAGYQPCGVCKPP